MGISFSYIQPRYHSKIDEEIKSLLKSYSSKANYDDDKWYLDNLHRNIAEGKYKYTLYFSSTPKTFINIIKQYAILTNTAIHKRSQEVYNINYFFEFIESIGVCDLLDVDRRIINRYEAYLRQNTKFNNRLRHDKYSVVYKFFETMKSFPNVPDINPVKRINPFKFKISKINEKQMVPKEVLNQYDLAMRSETVPLELRVIYWICRMIPNRLNEVLSMERNCLKPLFNHYNLLINTWKQNGGYIVPEVKIVPVKYEEHGKFLVDLIKKQQSISNELKQKLGENKQQLEKMLFLTTMYNFTEKKTIKDECDYKERLLIGKGNKIFVYNENKFKQQIKKVAKMFNIRDKDGNLYYLKSHQLRHVNITLRKYSNYTTEQISMLSNHKSRTMLNQYDHRLEEIHCKISKDIHELERSTIDAPVSFKGRIMNLDDNTIKILTKSPRAYLMGKANGKKGVGICSDILGCKNKFECYGCDFFVPKAEYLDDYKAELRYWEDRLINFIKLNKMAEVEKAQYNIKLISRIIMICNNGIEKYKKELQEKINSGNIDLNTPNLGGAKDAGAIR